MNSVMQRHRTLRHREAQLRRRYSAPVTVVYTASAAFMHERQQRSQDADEGREWSAVRTDPKTERSVRDVPLPKRALAALLDLRASSQGTGFVFGMRDKGNVLRRFYKTLKRAGPPQVRFRSLRVTSNSVLIEQGADPVEIAARMGHTSTA